MQGGRGEAPARLDAKRGEVGDEEGTKRLEQLPIVNERCTHMHFCVCALRNYLCKRVGLNFLMQNVCINEMCERAGLNCLPRQGGGNWSDPGTHTVLSARRIRRDSRNETTFNVGACSSCCMRFLAPCLGLHPRRAAARAAHKRGRAPEHANNAKVYHVSVATGGGCICP